MWITELSEEDLDQAAALEQDCFGSQAWSRQALADAVINENALYLVLKEEAAHAPFQAAPDPVLVGYCGVWLSFEEGGNHERGSPEGVPPERLRRKADAGAPFPGERAGRIPVHSGGAGGKFPCHPSL